MTMLLTDAERAAVRAQLRVDEGFVSHAYQDSLGYWTIGIGRLIDKRKGGGITEDEAEMLLEHDLAKVEGELLGELPWVAGLDGVRKQVLANMAFNMGMPTLRTFRATLAAIKAGDYVKAADQMAVSKWHFQVGARAVRLEAMMRTGKTGGATLPHIEASISALQSALNRLGAKPRLRVDGDLGPLTAEAVRRFQSANGLVTSGIADGDTWERIRDALAELDA
jgi:lysozyme